MNNSNNNNNMNNSDIYDNNDRFKPLIIKDINDKDMPTMLKIYKNFLINQSARPRIPYSISKQIDPNSLIYINKTKESKCSKLDESKIKKLKSIIDIKHSGYIGNI